MSLKNLLKNYLKEKGKATRDELYAFGLEKGYNFENTGRQLRALREEGKISQIFNSKGYIVGYVISSKEYLKKHPKPVSSQKLRLKKPLQVDMFSGTKKRWSNNFK